MSKELCMAFFVSLAAHASLVGIGGPLHVRDDGEHGTEPDIVMVGTVELSRPMPPEPSPESEETLAPTEESIMAPLLDPIEQEEAAVSPARPPEPEACMSSEVPIAGEEHDAGRPQFTEGQIADLRSRYLRAVVAQLESAKRYPRLAYRRGEEGTVEMSFAVFRDGRPSAPELRLSSGYRSLDKAAAEMVPRAAPFHPIPQELGTDCMHFTVPVVFTIKDMQ